MRKELKQAVLAAAVGWLTTTMAIAQSRGSAEEKAAFEKHQLGIDKNNFGTAYPPDAPAEGEKRENLLPGERPALRFLKKKKGGLGTHATNQALPSKVNSLENSGISAPAEFEADYHLDQDAEVVVTILGPNGAIVREIRLKPGAVGGKAGRNVLNLWDGRDQTGREAEPGPYQAVMNIKDGTGLRGKVIMLRKGS